MVPALREAGLSGGAYIGVGPDQNFSYIAQIKPAIAFIVDLRRDNLLLHLLFKALFSMSDTRAEYLSLLFGRPIPAPRERVAHRHSRQDRRVRRRHAAGRCRAITELRARVDAKIKTFGVPLSDADFATIDRFHRRFVTAGLPLKFQTTGRAPQSYYPTYRDLLLETDRQGQRWNFLASEDDFQFVRSLERRDLVDPRRRRSRGTVGARRDRPPDGVAGRSPVRLLRVERRVLSVRRRQVRALRGEPGASARIRTAA